MHLDWRSDWSQKCLLVQNVPILPVLVSHYGHVLAWMLVETRILEWREDIYKYIMP